MDTAQLEQESAQLIQSIKASVANTGNGAVETTVFLKKLFPQGCAGREQDYLSLSKCIETIFALAHAPAERTAELWKVLSVCALSGLRTSTI